jgi:hypothetical protein
MKKRNEDDPDNLEKHSEELSVEALEFINRLLERLHQADYINQGSKIEVVYVASGGQHVETQYISLNPNPSPKGEGNFKGRGVDSFTDEQGIRTNFDTPAERIRHCIALLMQEKCGNEPLFNQQNHWQAVYRILVDKGYCRDSDFDGFDTFIHTVMPEEVNKPYSKGSLKQISQTDFVRPFNEWRYDVLTSKTRKPYDRMVAVARRFLEILGENGQ